MRAAACRGLVLAACLATTAPVAAQLPHHAPADTGRWWHSAEELRPVVDRDGGPRVRELALAEAELGLGRAERAVEILRLARRTDSLAPPARVLLGTASFLVGDYTTAGREFEAVAAAYPAEERGVLLARAAESYRLAGADSLAAGLFQRARAELPWIDGWLAVREAMVTADAASALRLLRRAPPEAASAAARVRAQVLLQSADSVRALAALMQSRQWAVALNVATAVGDTAEARRAAYEALLASDSTTLRAGVTAARERFAPDSQQELFLLASALRQTGRTRDAISLLQEAAAHGDSSGAVLRRMADLQSSIGAHGPALETYARAAGQDGSDAALAAYRRARLLTRIGRTSEGHAAMATFANGYGDHPEAPVALYLVGSWYGDRGLLGTADSIFAEVASRWPQDRYASRARIRLAQAALVAGDTIRASQWYRSEVEAEAEEANAARYFLGDLANRTSDSVTAARTWSDLARRDSVGYYGTLARSALAQGPAVFAPPPQVPESPEATLTLHRVDLLYACFLAEDAAVVVERQVQRREFQEEELLALAAGLIARGWTQEGVSLGWKATRTRTLNDPLVLRLIFPLPLRDMVDREAREHGLDPYLLAGLIRQESNFRPTVVSRAGAVGLMQLMPATGRELLRREGVRWDERLLRSAEANMHLGARHLATLLKSYDGKVVPTLAAYNAGSRPVARWLRYPEAADTVQFVERIPYVETRGYIRAVLRNRSLYRALYPGLGEPATQGVR